MSTAAEMDLFGVKLAPKDHASLAARWIPAEFAEKAWLRRVDPLTGRAMVGRKSGNIGGIAIPYIMPGQSHPVEYRIRLDQAELELREGQIHEKGKYLGPAGRPSRLYFVPSTTTDICQNIEIPVLFVEGEFKGIACSRLAAFQSDRPRFLPIAVAGVWNWKCSVGKTPGENGDRVDVKGPSPDLDLVAWSGRLVYIAYDADVIAKEQVRIARAALARELRGRGAKVAFYEWDATKGKGIDDHLVAVGPEVVLQEIAAIDFEAKDWKANLILNKDGAPRASLANAITALRQASEWSDVLQFNEFALRVSTSKPTPWSDEPIGEWSDHEDRLTANWLQHASINISVKEAGMAVQVVARDRPFHPVRDYLDPLKWDGVKRLEAWLSTYLGVTETPYSLAVGPRWMISAIARIYRPGCKADCALVLEGPQGILKSTSVRTLAPRFFTDEIADLGSKDAAMQARGVWLIEIAELDSLSRPEIGKVKAFMSRTVDRFRPTYAAHVIESPRSCIFAGSVNHSTYLKDETGGRRFWPVVCGVINIKALEADRDQLWAEARDAFRAGSPWWLETADLTRAAANEQEKRYERDPWQSIIAPWLEEPSQRFDDNHPIEPFTSGMESITITDILLHCIAKRTDQWTQADMNRVQRCLTAMGWERFQKRVDGVREWRYRRKDVTSVTSPSPLGHQ